MIGRLDKFTRAYIAAALWSQTAIGSPAADAAEANGVQFDTAFDAAGYGIDDLSAELYAGIVEDCAAFQRDHTDDLGMLYPDQCGHDFWLTRNRHGAGFWDRGYPRPLGDRLTEAAHAYGEESWYVGDDGKSTR